MRVWGLGLMLVAVVSAGGCAAGIFQPASPTLADLERGDVHVSKVQGIQDSDIYKITYVANVPADVAWETAMEMPQWLRNNRMVGEFAPLPTEGDRRRRRRVTAGSATWFGGATRRSRSWSCAATTPRSSSTSPSCRTTGRTRSGGTAP